MGKQNKDPRTLEEIQQEYTKHCTMIGECTAKISAMTEDIETWKGKCKDLALEYKGAQEYWQKDAEAKAKIEAIEKDKVERVEERIQANKTEQHANA